MFITTAAAGNFFLQAERAVSLRSAGYDFLAFYTAGTFVRTGEVEKLYDLGAVRAFQQDVARRHGMELSPDVVGPFWNPPFYAWVFAPLSALSYPSAFALWTILNLACLVGAMMILCTIVARAPRPCESSTPDWRTWALVPLLTLTSMPLIASLGHGQNTCISLLILSITVALWRGNRSFAAGAVAGLLFYKPQLGAVVALVLIICCGWRAFAGLVTTGAALLLATVLTLPGALATFFTGMPKNLAFMQVQRPYLWDRHVTLKSFWRLLVQGYEAGEMSAAANMLYAVTVLIAAGCVFACIWSLRRRGDDDVLARDRIISITILAMPLLMPFYFDYDLLLLAVPAVLTAREAIVRGAGGIHDRHVTLVWVALYAWLIVNPHVAGATRVNGTVILLATLSAITMTRAMRRPAAAAVADETTEPTPLRRAA